MSLKESKIREMESNITSTANKVLHAVPIQAPWSRRQIEAELHRQGICIDTKRVEGCLFSLKETGLIREPTTGEFIRIMPKQTTQHYPSLMTVDPFNPSPPPAAPSTVDQMARLASDMRRMAKELQVAAGALDDAALRIEEERSSAEQGNAKLQQLKSLLKDIGG